MGIIEIDKLDNLLARHAELKVAVDAFGQTLNEVRRYANETNIVVKDILTGRQIGAWVDDLAASGKNSATYKDASRMNALLESKDSCRNNKVSQHIFDFAVANNKTGTYFGTALDNAGGVSWATLTTPASVCGNTAAFALVAKDEIAFGVTLDNGVFRPTIFDNRATLENTIKDSSVAINIMKKKQKKLYNQGFGEKVYNGKYFVLNVYSSYYEFEASIDTLGGTISVDQRSPVVDNMYYPVNKFSNHMTMFGYYDKGTFGFQVFDFA